MIFERHLTSIIKDTLQFLPIVTLTGPRQSGKTTLCRKLYNHLPYVNLEDISSLNEIEDDPKGFLSRYPSGLVIDEAQRFPEIFSYLQVIVDEDRFEEKNHRHYIVTGSSNFSLVKSISQSMAGRTSVNTLLPLSVKEICSQFPDSSTSELILKGGYPAIWTSQNDGRQLLLANYHTTYVERDLHYLVNIKDLHSFNLFIRLCAGRIGTELNISSLSVEVGVSTTTIRSWLSVLEASYIIYLLPPFHANINKRLVKAPKLYFVDTGLASWLLGINTTDQLDVHPMRGPLFENLVVNEAIKLGINQGTPFHLYFYRDKGQHEVDLIKENPNGTLQIFEIKASKTYRSDYFKNINYLKSLIGNQIVSSQVVYDGSQEHYKKDNGYLNFRNINM